MKDDFLEELQWRGLIYQKTPDIEEAFKRKTTLYLGIDPTGDSLHAGHLLGVLLLRRAYKYGNKIIILLGGGTAMIGDPSGKEEERPILPKEVIEENKQKLKKQLSRFFTIDEKNVRMIDNAEWLEKTSLIEFLREAGKYISVSSMIDKEAVQTRISRQEGISYAEFSYQLMQAYDFLVLYEKYNCEVQVGGSDQWGNIVQGVELVRKKTAKSAFGLSFPLIVNPKTGKKFGKTEKGAAIWLDPVKTHPFAFYNFFINIEDEFAPLLLKYYSFKSREEIEQIINEWQGRKELRSLQKELAFELTSVVHGNEVAEHCKEVASILFEKGSEALEEKDVEFIKKAVSHRTTVSAEEIVLDRALVGLDLCASNNEARRLVAQGGAKMKKIGDKYYLIQKGKKEFGIYEVIK